MPLIRRFSRTGKNTTAKSEPQYEKPYPEVGYGSNVDDSQGTSGSRQAASSIADGFRKRALDGKANAFMDELENERPQSSASPIGEGRSFDSLSAEDKEMAEWLAEQGVDVTHIMAPAAAPDRAPSPSIPALARARVAKGSPAYNRRAEAPAAAASPLKPGSPGHRRTASAGSNNSDENAKPEDNAYRQVNHKQMLNWLSEAEAQADETPEAVARRREKELAEELAKARLDAQLKAEAEEKRRAEERAVRAAKEEEERVARKKSEEERARREAEEAEAERLAAIEAFARAEAEAEAEASALAAAFATTWS